MPKVPFRLSQVEATKEAPSAFANPSAFTVGPEAFAKAGQAVADVGEKAALLGRVYEVQQKQARDAAQENAVKTAVYKDREAIADRLQYTTDAMGQKVPRTDYGNLVPDIEALNQQNLQKYQGMVSDPQVWQRVMPFVALHQSDNITTAQKHATTLEHAGWIDDWSSSVPVYQNLVAGATTPDEAKSFAQEFTDNTTRLIRAGVIKPQEGQAAIHNVAVKGDLTRAQNVIDADPDAWVKQAHDPADYPYLSDPEFRSLNRYAVQQARENRAVARQEQQETFEKNSATIVDAMVKAAIEKKPFTFTDLSNMLAGMGHNPGGGKLAISPSEGLTLKNNIQARLDHLDVVGRQEPKMTADAWVRYGDLLDKIHNQDAGYQDIARQTGTFPTGIIANLMGEVKNQGKADRQSIYKYAESFRKSFASSAFAELKNDLSSMMTSGDYKPDQWQGQAQKIIQQKWQSSGAIQGLVNERLNPGAAETAGGGRNWWRRGMKVKLPEKHERR